MFIFENRALLILCCVSAGILGAVMGVIIQGMAFRMTQPESGDDRLKIVFARGRMAMFGAVFLGVMSVLCLLESGLTLTFGRNFIFGCCLYMLALVDLKIYEIPNVCVWLPALLWVVTAPFAGNTLKTVGFHVLAGLVFGGGMLLVSWIFDKLLQKDSLGGGDIKLFAVMGLYLGFLGALFALILSCVFGLIFICMRRSKQRIKREIPFGPAIALATWVMLLYGSRLTTWYIGLLL